MKTYESYAPLRTILNEREPLAIEEIYHKYKRILNDSNLCFSDGTLYKFIKFLTEKNIIKVYGYLNTSERGRKPTLYLLNTNDDLTEEYLKAMIYEKHNPKIVEHVRITDTKEYISNKEKCLSILNKIKSDIINKGNYSSLYLDLINISEELTKTNDRLEKRNMELLALIEETHYEGVMEHVA